MESAAPVLSRRHEVGAGSARGLLFTLLGEFVLPSEGAAWTSAVLAAFERLGVAEKATRQALMRTSNAGWLQPEKVGRRTRWRLTPAATKLLGDGAKRIYSSARRRRGTASGCSRRCGSPSPIGAPGTWCGPGLPGPGSARSAPACGSARTPTASARRSGC